VLPALSAWADTLPTQLCQLGAKGLAQVPLQLADQLCPLKAAAALLPRPSSQRAALDLLAASPRTAGGAAALLAKGGNATQAAALQARLCGVLLDPVKACGLKLPKGANLTSALGGAFAAHVSKAAPTYWQGFLARAGAPFTWRGAAAPKAAGNQTRVQGGKGVEYEGSNLLYRLLVRSFQR
jgi:hypothetical protein